MWNIDKILEIDDIRQQIHDSNMFSNQHAIKFLQRMEDTIGAHFTQDSLFAFLKNTTRARTWKNYFLSIDFWCLFLYYECDMINVFSIALGFTACVWTYIGGAFFIGATVCQNLVHIQHENECCGVPSAKTMAYYNAFLKALLWFFSAQSTFLAKVNQYVSIASAWFLCVAIYGEVSKKRKRQRAISFLRNYLYDKYLNNSDLTLRDLTKTPSIYDINGDGVISEGEINEMTPLIDNLKVLDLNGDGYIELRDLTVFDEKYKEFQHSISWLIVCTMFYVIGHAMNGAKTVFNVPTIYDLIMGIAWWIGDISFGLLAFLEVSETQRVEFEIACNLLGIYDGNSANRPTSYSFFA